MNKYFVYSTPPLLPRSRRNELKHYGVIGMKWGVRRYQNDDGSLTDAGKSIRDLHTSVADIRRSFSRAGDDAISARKSWKETGDFMTDLKSYRSLMKPYEEKMESYCSKILSDIGSTDRAIRNEVDDGVFLQGTDRGHLYEASSKIKSAVNDALNSMKSSYVPSSEVADKVRYANWALDDLFRMTDDYR